MKGNKRTFTVRTWKRTDNLSDASLLEAEIERRDGAEFPCRISASQLSFPVIQRIHPFQVNMRTNLQSCKKKKAAPNHQQRRSGTGARSHMAMGALAGEVRSLDGFGSSGTDGLTRWRWCRQSPRKE
jgi:hypothetical protein